LRKSVEYSHDESITEMNYRMALKIKKEIDEAVFKLQKKMNEVEDIEITKGQMIHLKEYAGGLKKAVTAYRGRVGISAQYLSFIFDINNYYPVYEVRLKYQKVVSEFEGINER